MTLMMGLSIYDRQVRLCGIPDASVPAVHDTRSTFVPGSLAAAALRAESVGVRLHCPSGEGPSTRAS